MLPHEKTSCALARKILDREDGVYLIERRPGLVDGVFFFAEGDILLPCLPGVRGGGLKALSSFLDGRELFCISGLEDELSKVRRLLPGLSAVPRLCERRSYYFFEYRDRDAARKALSSLPPGCSLRMAGPEDEEALFPLHASYMAEEVLLAGRKLHEAFERRQLRESLEKQVVVVAVREQGSGFRLVSKAGTNAIAARVMQLGGIYTVREERGRGLAAALTAFLAESAAQKGLATVLFVNRENAAAIAAYRAAGFQDSGKAYTIEYYGMP